MTAMIALLVVALVVEIIAHQGWTAVTPPNFHSYVGCMAYDLSFVVYGMGFFVKPSQYGSSNIPAAVHVVGGNLVYFLCFILIILADRVSFSGLACHIKWIVGAWGFIYCAFQCFFTVNAFSFSGQCSNYIQFCNLMGSFFSISTGGSTIFWV